MTMLTTTQINVRSTVPHMPAFVTRRMDAHHVTRIAQLMGGEHVHVWKRPGPGTVMLAGNDYLCLSNEPSLLLPGRTACRRTPARP